MMDGTKDKSLEDTGERMIPAYSRGYIVYGEHMVRYEAVSPILKDKIVLDIASGSGYGSELLGRTASKVIGVDISREAVEYAKKNYSSDKVKFLEGSGTEIPLGDASVDAVVSFETIEHIEEYDKFLEEIKRVLKPGGILVLSTPNDQEYSEDNHFHIHEFKESELRQLIKKYFKNHQTYYQGDWVYSAVLEKTQLDHEWSENIATQQRAPIDTKKSIYFMIIASDDVIAEKIQPLAVISEHWSARKNRNKEQVFKKHMDDQAVIIKHFKDEVKNREEELTELRQQNQKLKQTIYWKTRHQASRIKSKISRKGSVN